MLNRFRQSMKSTIATIFLGVIVLSMALWGIENYMRPERAPDVLATINDQMITKRQFDHHFDPVKRELLMAKASAHDIDLAKDKALEDLINQTALGLLSKQDGLYIGDGLIEAWVRGNKHFRDEHGFSADRFYRYLEYTSQDQQSFISMLAQRFGSSFYDYGISTSAFLLDDEYDAYRRMYGQIRHVSTLTLRYQDQLRNIKPVDSRVAYQYFLAHQSRYVRPERARFKLLVLDANVLAKGIHVTRRQALNHYKANIDRFTQPAVYQLTIKRLMPTQKKQQAHNLSLWHKVDHRGLLKQFLHDHPNLDLLSVQEKHWVSARSLPDDLASILKGHQSGRFVSSIDHAKNVLLLIELHAFKPAKVKPFQEVEPGLRASMLKKRTQDRYRNALQDLSDRVYASEDFNDIGRAMGLKPIHTPWITRDAKGIDHQRMPWFNKKLAAKAFERDVLDGQFTTDPIELADGLHVLIAVDRYKPQENESFKQVKKRIVATIAKHRALQQIQAMLVPIESALKSGMRLEAISEKFNLKFAQHTLSYHQDDARSMFVFLLPEPNEARESYGRRLLEAEQGFELMILNRITSTNQHAPRSKAQVLTLLQQADSLIFSKQIHRLVKIKRFERPA